MFYGRREVRSRKRSGLASDYGQIGVGFQTRSILGTKKSDDVLREATIGTIFSLKGSGIEYLSGNQSNFTKSLLNSSNSIGNYGAQEGFRK